MKLDNRGWGLSEMLILMAVLILFLLISVFLSHQLSGKSNNIFLEPLVKTTYTDVEENVKNAALSYFKDYYDSQIDTGTITVTTINLLKYNHLQEKDLTPSSEKEACLGYALIHRENEGLEVQPFIGCKNYETTGYQSWRLGE